MCNSSVIKVGSLVSVVDGGCCYSTYDEFLKRNCPDLVDNFKFGLGVDSGVRGIVVFIGKHHLYEYQTVCVVRTNNRVFLIEISGLKYEKDFSFLESLGFSSFLEENGTLSTLGGLVFTFCALSIFHSLFRSLIADPSLDLGEFKVSDDKDIKKEN